MKTLFVFTLSFLALLKNACVLASLITHIENPSIVQSKQQLCNIISYQFHVKRTEACIARVNLACESSNAIPIKGENLRKQCQQEMPKLVCSDWQSEDVQSDVRSTSTDWKSVREENPQVSRRFAEHCDNVLAPEPEGNLQDLIKIKIDTEDFCRELMPNALEKLMVSGVSKVVRQVHCT